MLHLDARFEIKELAQSGLFTGYGSIYDTLDLNDDIVQAGAFAQSLAGHQQKGTMPAMLWQHRAGEPIGAYSVMREDSKGLFVEGQLALKTQRGGEAYELLQMKAVDGLSVGFMTREDSIDRKTNIRTIKRADLFEVSLVTMPANESARVSTVKNIEEVTDFKSAERFLRDSGGLSRSEATAFFTRVKGLVQRDSVADNEARQLIAALSRRQELLRT